MLEHSTSAADTNLYGALKQALEKIRPSDLTWKDPKASMVLSDTSDIVKNLKHRQKGTFLEPKENMICVVPDLIVGKCDDFVNNFTNLNASRAMRNIFYNKNWKESEAELVKVTDRIFNTLGKIWCNPAFLTHASCSEQSEGIYVTEVIIPLLRSSLGNLPNGCIVLSTAERESLASKARRNIGMNEIRMGKKPNVMGLLKYNEQIIELLYTESSAVSQKK